ncbi:MAG: metal-dependent hydrolase [Rhizobiales bacterium]|nr:metal-dependent hydrolase [Hyphomicrobiales bacterium]
MKLTWFGHSAFRLEIGSSVILIDPFLTGNPMFKGDVADASAGVTHILLTHGHDDHVGDAAAIAARTGAQVVSNFEICMFLMEQGAKNINPGNTGGTVPCGEFAVTFTQALHSSGTVKDGKSIYLGNPNGLIIRHPDAPTIYHMGDTDLFGDMALIDEIYRPKIGMVPIGDRFTMSAQSAAFALTRYFSFDLVVPCHYATFDLLAPNADEFIAEMAGSKTRVLVPTSGEAVTL